MSDRTKIEWTRSDDGTPGATWNPVTGCTKVSPGCDHCYAKTFAERWRGTPGHYFERGFDVQVRPDKLDQPLRWKKPRKIFVNSMSDLFHDDVPDEYIAQVFAVMALAPRHTFQVLTKRHARMRALLSRPSFPELVTVWAWRIAPGQALRLPRVVELPLPNVWLGVSTENQQWADIRIPALLDTPAAVRFISAEPLLGQIYLPFKWTSDQPRIDWVIAGGESGHAARPMHPDWPRVLRDICNSADIPFLFKQWGEYGPECRLGIGDSAAWHQCACNGSNPSHLVGMKRVGKKQAGRELDGRTWDQYPGAVTDA